MAGRLVWKNDETFVKFFTGENYTQRYGNIDKSCRFYLESRMERSRMKDCRQFYIDGKWVSPIEVHDFEVISPANEEPIATISLGSAADVNGAVAAAKRAFASYSETPLDKRLALLQRIIQVYQSRSDEMARTISQEMGAPLSLSQKAQAPAGLAHLNEIVSVLGALQVRGTQRLERLCEKSRLECADSLLPWNWPMYQVVCKVAPALAAGCTMVLKPSEIAPLSAYLLAEILDEAEVPHGVFNMLNGDGPTVGAAISLASRRGHGLITPGSTRGGVAHVAHGHAAPTVKLGHGKSLAASRPTLSWTTPTLRMQSKRARRHAFGTPASPAMLLPACSFHSPRWLMRLDAAKQAAA